MSDPPNGRLVPIDRSNWRRALEVRVTDEQLPMVADHQPVALVILAKAYVRPGDRSWEPLAYVEADGTVMAVLALAHADGVSEVVNLAVDAVLQGKGVGTEVMNAVLARSRARGSTTVELTVDLTNEAATRLYERVGFSPTGEMRQDEPVWSVALLDDPRTR